VSDTASILSNVGVFQVFLTDEQRFFTGGHLMFWGAVESRDECG